jgi:hypothetical protein
MKNLNLSNIKDFIKKIKWTSILFIGLLVSCVGVYTLYKNNLNKLEIAEWNLKTQNDTIKTLKNKAGENVYKINSLILSKKDLEKTNSDLSAEIDKLSKKDKRNLVEINKLNLSINLLNDSIKKLNNKPIDSIYDPTTKLTTYNYELKDSTEFRELKGVIKVTSSNRPNRVSTDLTVDKVFTDLIIGKTLNNDKLELFVSSSNSGLVVDKLEGSVIDLKAYQKLLPKKKFSIGFQVGYGFTAYGLTPYIGIGGSYNLINF